jgi:transcriptional regulator with XRE-family HTH domain
VEKKEPDLSRVILTDAQRKKVVKGMENLLGPHFMACCRDAGMNTADFVSFMPVASTCRTARESRGLTVKAAAKALKVQQYRLHDIERGQYAALRTDVLQRYIEFLDLTEWFEEWKTANPRLAKRLGTRTPLRAPRGESAVARKIVGMPGEDVPVTKQV